MFTQVYFHKTRVAFDYHLQHALGEMLPNGHSPRPTGDELDDFLKWDDWRVVGNLASGAGGEHGQRLCQRTHFREVFHTPETPTRQDLARFERVCDDLGKMLRVVVPAEKSWYKVDETDIQVQSDNPGNQVFPLSKLSSAIARLKPIRKRMAYCSPEDQERAADVVANRVGSKRKGTKQ